MRLFPKRRPIITAETQPAVASAMIDAWQQHGESEFAVQLSRLIIRAHDAGLDRQRIVRALAITSNGLDKQRKADAEQ